MELFQEIFALLKGFGDLTAPAKVGVVIMILIAVWKSSMFQPYWDKLGASKILVAPVLGLLLSFTQLPVEKWELSAVYAAIVTGIQNGALAMGFHTLISALEQVPWLGEKYKKFLGFVDTILFKPKA